MAHLIAQPTAGISISDCLRQLREAHEVVRQAGARAATSVAELSATTDWGTKVKRTKVTLPAERPLLLQSAPSTHSFAEVMNQCATVERMVDALAWAETAFPGWTVLACHPTTSSATHSPDLNNDLVLRGPNDERARFEVSDVAGDGDGNRKEEKDLANLGWIREGGKPKECAQGRTFLVVSENFGRRIANEGRPVPQRPLLAYHPLIKGPTWIIEVRRLIA